MILKCEITVVLLKTLKENTFLKIFIQLKVIRELISDEKQNKCLNNFREM